MTRLMTRWCDTVWISMNLPQDSTDSYVEFVLTTALSWGLGIFSEFSFGVPSCNVFRSPVEWKQHGICLAETIARLINLDSLPQRCLRLILSERLSREALSRRKINFSPGEYALIGHNSINLQDFIRLIGIYHSWYYCCWCWCCCWIYHPIFQGAWSNGTCFFRGVMSGFHDMHVRARTVAKQKTSKSSPI